MEKQKQYPPLYLSFISKVWLLPTIGPFTRYINYKYEKKDYDQCLLYYLYWSSPKKWSTLDLVKVAREVNVTNVQNPFRELGAKELDPMQKGLFTWTTCPGKHCGLIPKLQSLPIKILLKIY